MMHVHSDRLERWLGADEIAKISDGMRNWYGKAIPVANVPGKVWAQPGGDFTGYLDGGGFMSLLEKQVDRTNQFARQFWRKAGRVRHGQMNAGFASLSDLISEATTGAKRREFTFAKTGATGVTNVTNSLWYAAGQPTVGATPSNAPGGDAPTDATTGGFLFSNPTGGDTQHFLTGYISSSVAAQTLLLYDRIFQVNKTMNSTATESVTGVPTRYLSATSGAADSAENNFLFVEVQTALAATAHNWTTCTYTDQSNNTGATLPSLIGNSAAIANRLDHPVGQWFAPLATGDTGIRNLTQMQCSAAVATGAISFVIGHPLVFMPVPVANLLTLQDGLSSGFTLARVFDDACLSFLELTKSASTATTYAGYFLTVAG
jgi:hypothetical protein